MLFSDHTGSDCEQARREESIDILKVFAPEVVPALGIKVSTYLRA